MTFQFFQWHPLCDVKKYEFTKFCHLVFFIWILIFKKFFYPDFIFVFLKQFILQDGLLCCQQFLGEALCCHFIFQQITVNAILHGASGIIETCVGRNKDNIGIWIFFFQDFHEIKTIHYRHGNI